MWIDDHRDSTHSFRCDGKVERRADWLVGWLPVGLFRFRSISGMTRVGVCCIGSSGASWGGKANTGTAPACFVVLGG